VALLRYRWRRLGRREGNRLAGMPSRCSSCHKARGLPQTEVPRGLRSNEGVDQLARRGNTGCKTHDTVIEILLPLQARGITQIDLLEIQRPLKKWVDAGKTSGKWFEPTIIRIAQGLLSALRDFGVLQGAVKKRIAPAYLPVAASSTTDSQRPIVREPVGSDSVRYRRRDRPRLGRPLF
jgi:hypothetical protein